MKNILFLFISSLLLFSACKKDEKNDDPQPDVEIVDDLAAEADAIKQLDEDLENLETGALKELFDTSGLKPKDKYIVLFKSSFQPPLAEVYSGDDEGKEAAGAMHVRNAQVKIKSLFDERTLPPSSISTWFSVLSSGFVAELTPDQIKTIYNDSNVKCISTQVYYSREAEPVYAKDFTDGLFIHGHKSGAGKSNTIWVVDEEALTNSTYYNYIASISKGFGTLPASSAGGHGSVVAFVAGGKEQSKNAFRGTATNARIAIVNCDESWESTNSALEHVWLKSKNGDIVNCSWSCDVKSGAAPIIIEMENNLLDFEGWQMAVVIAAGNQKTYASNRSPARLGLKYKKKPTPYSFLYCVAAIVPDGTESQIKNATCNFKLADYSNFGSAVRVAMIGSWQIPTGTFETGTSYAAPALCGVLYHNTNPATNPKYLAKEVSYKKGKYTFKHKIATLN